MQAKRTLLYTLLFFFSFFVFLYVSFPYTIVKESIVTHLMKATGLDIRVKSLGPKLPLGLELTKLQVKMPSGGKAIEVSSAVVRLRLLALLAGKAGAEVTLEDASGGTFDLDATIGIFDLIGGDWIPSFVGLEAENFPIDNIVYFGLAQAKAAMKSQALVADLIGKFGVEGNLSGKLELDLDPGNPLSSEGEVDLQIKKGVLMIDPSMGLANQTFKKALVKGRLASGSFKLDERSGIQTQGLSVDINGSLALKKNLDRSPLNLDLRIQLAEGLKEQFGFMIDTALGGSGGGIKCQIRGTLRSPKVVTL